MESTREVISAFLDGENFDPEELMAALSDQSGRELLVDLAALRRVVQHVPDDPTRAAAVEMGRRSRALRGRGPMPWGGAAAALVVALVGGYMLGASREPVVTEQQAPPATRVVQAVALENRSSGGVR